jgi:hypothetical protein
MDSDTRVYASTITEGPFSYHHYQGLTVNRHLREPGDKLFALLTWQDTGPALRKDGKPKVHQPPKHKDPNDAFYHAQCVHYGLKPLKTKSAAKKELLKAWERGGRKFVVPDHILRVEGELKEAFKVANFVAKEKYEEDEKVRLEAERKQQLKRKREDEKLLTEIAAAQEKSKKQKPNVSIPASAPVLADFQRAEAVPSRSHQNSRTLRCHLLLPPRQLWLILPQRQLHPIHCRRPFRQTSLGRIRLRRFRRLSPLHVHRQSQPKDLLQLARQRDWRGRVYLRRRQQVDHHLSR